MKICILLLISVETMLQKNAHGGIIEKKRKLFISNVFFFHLLNHDYLTLEYFAMQK
jgi:hypothetical protein